MTYSQKKSVIAALFICSALHTLVAQNTSNDFTPTITSTTFKSKVVLPPSPDAASLGKYGNVPVSLFTGTPQISIPIYEVKANSIDLPINLSYHASGFKPEEIASWVGLGWSLNAGGVITRSAIGNPDVEPYYFSNANNYPTVFAQTDLFAKSDALLNIKKGYMETQPDVYYYNFAGRSGKFYIKPDGTIVKKEKDNIKITHCITCFANASPNSSFFNIVDEKGNIFQFNEVEVSTTSYDESLLPLQSGEEPGIRSFTYPSSWYLSKITSADGTAFITFDYYTSSSPHDQYSNYLAYESASYTTSTEPKGSVVGETTNPNPDFTPCKIVACAISPGVVEIGSARGTPPIISTTQKYLKAINLNISGEITTRIDCISLVNQRQDLDHLNYSDERLLSSIIVNRLNDDGTYSIIKKSNFTYSYFTGTLDIPDQKRLRLDKIQELPNDISTPAPPPYTFNYNDGITPSLSTAGKDHWGFYNQESNHFLGFAEPTLVPTVEPGRGFGAIRDANFSGSSMNMLNKMTYPTGGYTTFQYELNDAVVNGIVTPIGGIRIKSITDYSFSNQKATQKTYSYSLPNGTSSGNAVIPLYTSSSSYHHYQVPTTSSCDGSTGFCSEGSTWDKQVFTVSASPVSALGSFQGSHIGYSRVIEVQSDVTSTATLGATIYSYFIGDMSSSNNDDIRTGDLLETKIQDNNGKDLKVISNTYSYLPYSSLIAATVRPDNTQSNKSILVKTLDASGALVSYTWYGVWETIPAPCSGCTFSTKLITTQLNLSGYFVTGTERQLVQTTERIYDQASDNYTVLTKKFTYGNPAHTLPTLVEESTSSNEVIGTINKYAGDFSLPTGVTLDNVSRGIQLLQSKNIVGAEIEKVQYRANADGTQKRYLNGSLTTFSDLYPYPKNVYQIETSVPLATLQPAVVNGSGSFSIDPSYQPLGQFSFQSNGDLLEQTKSSDLTKSYIWDDRFSNPLAEVTNAATGAIAYTSFENRTQTGYWAIGNVSNSNFITTDAFTGKQSLQLTSGTNILKHNLSPAPGFIVCYWAKNGPAIVKADVATIPGVAVMTKNGWTYYEHKTGSNPVDVTLTGAGAIIDELKLFPVNAQMSTETYDPMIGVVSSVSPSNQVAFFQYDGLNRLTAIKNTDGDIVKTFKYNYGLGDPILPSAKTLFQNAYQSRPFTKNDGCPVDSRPTTIVYSVAEGTYISSKDQTDADNKALAEITAKGQAYANSHGQCLYYNDAISVPITKNDCAASQGTGLTYLYTVPADKYTSTQSKTAANALAQAEIDQLGQLTANTNAGCSCGAINTKFINGACVTGVKVITGSISVGPGQYQCIYHYYFSQDNSVTIDLIDPTIQSSPCPVQ